MNISSPKQKAHFFFGERGEEMVFQTENNDGYIAPGKVRALVKKDFTITGLGIPYKGKKTKTGAMSADINTIKLLAGKLDGKGKRIESSAFKHFGGGKAGEAACLAIEALMQHGSVMKQTSTYITPLRDFPDKDGRLHCSLNIRTETGRLSARSPNLQNQPSLDKDVYKVRDMFAAAPGNKLVVADYGQLELRIMAIITKCKSMIDAFKLGGDFHSRTAMGMYKHVAKAVENGEVLLEWDSKDGAKPPVPMLKDKYGLERKNAKILNFSIAYGKTVYGLSTDFGVTKKEAETILQSWYADRPEVKVWQEATMKIAVEKGYTRTMMGRYRYLPDADSKSKMIRESNSRYAINTPIQGGAADVVMAAMCKLHTHKRFREIGWFMTLQVHDEVLSAP
jgi:DNA polymerase-1